MEKRYSESQLRKMYWGDGMSLSEMADHFGVSKTSVREAMVRRGIERRPVRRQLQVATYYVNVNGYCRFRTSNAEQGVSVHQLLAIADGEDPHDVFEDGMHVHHKNNVQWDNRPENVELLSASEHISLHASERENEYDHTTDDWWDEELLREMYWDDGMTMEEIGDTLGVSQKTIQERLKDFGIETRGVGDTAPKPWKDESVLRELYVESDATQKEVAEKLGCTPHTIRNWLEKHGLYEEMPL